MNLQDRHYWLGFSCFAGIGPKKFFLLKKYFGSAKKAWQASSKTILKIGLDSNLVERFADFREKNEISSLILRLEKYLISFLIVDDEGYPKRLKEIDNPPIVLYIKGQIRPEDSLSIAVVGTRKISFYGREVTEKLVGQLVSHNITIVSGLARGVDSVAHREALKNGGRTIAVLGSGLDLIYPPEHKPLAQAIVKSGQGALVSEFPPGLQALPGNFPARNRIISGLSLGVLVTEGAADSGTKITASWAAKQGREVFAVPGPITSPLSQAPADLIKAGAKLVTGVNDILEELRGEDLKIPNNLTHGRGLKSEEDGRVKVAEVTKGLSKKNLSEEEGKIWQVLSDGAKQLDQIVKETDLSTPQVSAFLTLMEVKGIVKNLGEGIYALV